jgi:hypothetical protein
MSETAATDSAFLEDGTKALLTNVTEKGFTIWLPYPALRDYEYNWIAIAVDNKKRTVGKRIDVVAGLTTDKIQPTTVIPTPADFLNALLPTPQVIPIDESVATSSAEASSSALTTHNPQPTTTPPPQSGLHLFDSGITSASGGLVFQ